MDIEIIKQKQSCVISLAQYISKDNYKLAEVIIFVCEPYIEPYIESRLNSVGLHFVVTKQLIVRLSLLRKTILIPEYLAFMCVCVFVDGCISQF